MFYIEHLSQKTSDNGNMVFDARNWQWLSVPKESDLTEYSQFVMKLSIPDSEWENDNCHPNGYFRCPRCYKKHFVVDNFDFLCDGCVSLLTDHFPDHEASIIISNWNPNNPVVNERISLRMAIDKVVKSDKLYYNEREITILKDMLKNDGTFQIKYVGDEDKNKFVANVFAIKTEI